MPDGTESARVHSTCVAIGDTGVLLRGRPGAGKSDLALRLIDGGARLVADDQVMVSRDRDGVVWASAPETLRNVIEVRGIGLVRLDETRVAVRARLGLVVDLQAPAAGLVADRLPDPDSATMLGVALPRLSLDAFEASAPAKVRLAAGHGPGAIMTLP